MPKRRKPSKYQTARLARGLTQVALSRLADVGLATVIRCEAEDRLPHFPDPKARYLAALGMTDAPIPDGNAT